MNVFCRKKIKELLIIELKSFHSNFLENIIHFFLEISRTIKQYKFQKIIIKFVKLKISDQEILFFLL